MTPEGLELLLSLFTALAAGFVIGAEREQGDEASFGGIRTFSLYGLAGALAMLLGWGAALALGGGLAALLAIAYYRESGDDPGMSTQVAALVTFALGGLCTTADLGLPTSDRLLLVAAGATATLGLLSVKRPLHGIVHRIRREEIYATAKLLLLSLVVLPLLPSEDIGPWEALNPRTIGMLVVLISAIGFAGYIAIRIFGVRRGFGLTGVLGGLASSTAVALTFSGRARATPELVNACAVAVILASATMFPRVLVEVWAVSPPLARAALWPFALAGVLALGAGGALYAYAGRGDSSEKETALTLKNPFTLQSALSFTLLFVLVLLVSRGASESFDDAGLYVSAFLAGLADVDAISLSIARMHQRGSVGDGPALTAIAIASATNTLSKVGIAWVLGGVALGVRVGGVLGVALLGGALSLVWVG